MSSEPLRMYTRRTCEDSDAARAFLKAHGIPFIEIDIDEDPAAMEFVMRVNQGKQRTPTFELNGRTFHGSHFDPEKFRREMGL